MRVRRAVAAIAHAVRVAPGNPLVHADFPFWYRIRHPLLMKADDYKFHGFLFLFIPQLIDSSHVPFRSRMSGAADGGKVRNFAETFHLMDLLLKLGMAYEAQLRRITGT